MERKSLAPDVPATKSWPDTPPAAEFYVSNPDRSALDTVTDARWITDRFPSMATQFAAIRSLRDHYWDLRKITSHGSIVGGAGGMKHVASIPQRILFAAERAAKLDGVDFWDERVFYAWLGRNPQYALKDADK